VIISDKPTSNQNALNDSIRLDVEGQGGGRTYTDDRQVDTTKTKCRQ